MLIILFFLCFGAFHFPTYGLEVPHKTYKSKLTAEHQTIDPNTTLKLLIWNLQKGSSFNWAQDFEKLTKNSDIAVTQEVWLNSDMYQSFFNWLGIEWLAVEAWNWSGTPTGVATLSRYVTQKAVGLHSVTNEPLFFTPKSHLITYYNIFNHHEKLMLINSHLLLLGSLQTYRRELKQITQYIKKHKGPVLWAGDFNTWYTSRQNLLDDTTQNLGLQKASWRNDTRSQRLDHAYIREFEVVSATVLAHIRSSDHSPLHLEVRIKSD